MHIRRCKQLSVYLENRAGALAELCDLLARESINLNAICAIDTVEEAVLRIVPEDSDRASEILRKAGFQVIVSVVLLVELKNVPGATGRTAALLGAAGINIDYIYASAHPDHDCTVLVLRCHEVDRAEEVLRGANL